MHIPKNNILLSLDVKNLFPSMLPPFEAIALTDQLLKNHICNPTVREDIINMLEVCLKQNYFEFNNIIYSDEDLAMGNMFSPLMAEIFMNNFEK